MKTSPSIDEFERADLVLNDFELGEPFLAEHGRIKFLAMRIKPLRDDTPPIVVNVGSGKQVKPLVLNSTKFTRIKSTLDWSVV